MSILTVALPDPARAKWACLKWFCPSQFVACAADCNCNDHYLGFLYCVTDNTKDPTTCGSALPLGGPAATDLLNCLSKMLSQCFGPVDASTDVAGASTADGGGGRSDIPVTTAGKPPVIPAVVGTCPTLATGTVTINGQTVMLWVGTKNPDAGAPVLFYWHGAGSTASEAQAFMGNQITEVTSAGGIVASFDSTTGTGTNTSGRGTFYSDDFNTADQILACAVKQLNIDTRRIFSAGCDSGGLQTGTMLYYRSSYLACGMPNSGGFVFPPALQDSHVPSLITTHGAAGTDVVGVDFSMTSLAEDMDIKSKATSSMPPGGYVVDCNHGGGHCAAPPDDIAAQWKFCKEHPFGVSPDPYDGGLPSGFPSYCVIQ